MAPGVMARGVLALCLVIATGVGAPAALASSAPVVVKAADRAQLRQTIAAARADNQVTARILKTLPAGDARMVREQLNRLRDSASALSAELSKSTGTPSKALANRIGRLGKQSAALRAGAASDSEALSALEETRDSALMGLRRGLSDGFPETFDADQYRLSAAGAHALADVTAARIAISTLTPLRRAPSAQRALAEARSGRLPAPVAGWTPIPGGCALPPGSEADYLPSATAPGPLLWTSPTGLAKHLAQLDAPSPALSAAYAKTMRQARSLSAQAGRSGSISEITKRVLTVGYAWLVTAEGAYGDALLADARMLSTATSEEPVEEAKQALVLATIIDWLGDAGEPPLPGDESDVLQRASEVLKIRMIGSLGCALALGENIAVDKMNKSVIIGSGAAMGALALAQDSLWRPGLASTVKAALLGARSGLEVLDVDGGSPEGPVYWNFQTVPAAGMLSSINATLPQRTVSTVPALERAGHYAWQMAAPSLSGDWETTRYSDTRDTVLRCTLPAWIAGKFGTPDAIAVALQGQLRQGVELLWWPDAEPEAPLGNAVFQGSGVAVLRAGEATAWLLGQPPITNHTQLDAGAVTVRVDGVDWSLDAGYGKEGPGYSEDKPGGKRWTYPQTQPGWHSTIRTVKSAQDPGQVVGATAPLALADGSASVDLSAVLAGAARAERRVTLSESGLTMVDTVSGSRQSYAWSWVTQAAIRQEGDVFVLRQDDRTAELSFEALPPGARVSVTRVPTALDMPGSRIQVQLPAASSARFVARLRW